MEEEAMIGEPLSESNPTHSMFWDDQIIRGSLDEVNLLDKHINFTMADFEYFT